MTKIFYIIGIIAFYLVLSIFMTYADLEYQSISGFNITTGETPTINSSQSSITLLGFFSILTGIFTFQIDWLPIWMNIILYLPLLGMVILIYEEIRGV